MGIVRKQSIQGSILLYFGVFVGFVTNAVLVPKILKPEQIGLLSTLLSYSAVFAQFATLGFNSVIIRNFSYFRNYQNKHNHFFFIVFLVMVIGSVLSVFVYFILRPFFIRQNIQNALLFVEYIDYLVPLIIFTLVFYILDAYYTVLYKTVRGIVLKEVIQRILILLALIFYYLKIYHFEGFTIGYVISLSAPGIILLFYILAEGEWVIRPRFDFINRDLARSMLSVGLFGILTSLIGSANLQVDRAMASSMISLDATGIYSTVIIFATLITVPSRPLLKIVSAVIADAWKRNDREEIYKVYKSTCLNLFILGILVFIGIIANIHNIFRILPPEYVIGKDAIIWLGLAYTIEMASGASNNVIATSPDYKVFTWMAVIRLILIVVSNFVFIPLFQLTGVAMAASVSSIIFSLIKGIYIYYKYEMQPYNLKFIYLAGIGLLLYLVAGLLPHFGNLIFDIILRSGIITIIYIILLFLLKISEELNGKIKNLATKIID